MSDLPATMSGNVSPLSVTLSLLPAAERDLLRYLAPLTSFDDEIAGEAAARHGPGEAATLAALIRYPFVREVQGQARPVPDP